VAIAVIMQTLCKRVAGGRVAAAEILMVNSAARNLIRERKTHMIPALMQSGRKDGMQTLDGALSDLAQMGQISVAEAKQRSVAQDLFSNVSSLPLAA
jgi:twitching motility protein PilT